MWFSDALAQIFDKSFGATRPYFGVKQMKVVTRKLSKIASTTFFPKKNKKLLLVSHILSKYLHMNCKYLSAFFFF